MSFERRRAFRRGGHNAFVNFGQVQVELIEPQDPSTMGARHAMDHVGYVTQDIHTFASMLIQAGESLAYVKEHLGHSFISIAVDTYGHLIPPPVAPSLTRPFAGLCLMWAPPPQFWSMGIQFPATPTSIQVIGTVHRTDHP
jgi:hypothetical protein